MKEEIRTETHRVSGERLVARVKELVRQGNIRRISIKGKDDRTLLEIPLTVGVVGAILLPVWVALGAIAALAADYTIEVEKVQPEGEGGANVPAGVTPGLEHERDSEC